MDWSELLHRFTTGDCYLEYDRTTGRYESLPGAAVAVPHVPTRVQLQPQANQFSRAPITNLKELSYDDLDISKTDAHYANGRTV